MLGIETGFAAPDVVVITEQDILGDRLVRRKKKRKGGIGRLLVLAVVGGAVAVGVSADLRNKVLDLLFGAEEEFDYTSTTAPSTPAPAQPEASASTDASEALLGNQP